MEGRVLLGVFDREEDILAATREVRKQGYDVIDTYTPYPVHGLEHAQGLRPSRLTWVCFLAGAGAAKPRVKSAAASARPMLRRVKAIMFLPHVSGSVWDCQLRT